MPIRKVVFSDWGLESLGIMERTAVAHARHSLSQNVRHESSVGQRRYGMSGSPLTALSSR